MVVIEWQGTSLCHQWRRWSRCGASTVLRASGGGRGNGKWTGERVDRRVGVFMSWPAALGRPRRVACASGDRRRVAPRGGDCLKSNRHCSVDSVTLRCLAAKLHRVGTANSLLKSEIHQYESCSPKYQVHFMLNDQDLISKES